MKLQNTKDYYRDLAQYYFLEGKAQLMTFFRGLASDNKYEYSKTDTNDWFELTGAQRPTKDPTTGLYILGDDMQDLVNGS